MGWEGRVSVYECVVIIGLVQRKYCKLSESRLWTLRHKSLKAELVIVPTEISSSSKSSI